MARATPAVLMKSFETSSSRVFPQPCLWGRGRASWGPRLLSFVLWYQNPEELSLASRSHLLVTLNYGLFCPGLPNLFRVLHYFWGQHRCECHWWPTSRGPHGDSVAPGSASWKIF